VDALNSVLQILVLADKDHNRRLSNLESSTSIQLITKTTTGNLTPGYEGQMVINTFDNNLKIYADSGWRTLVSW